MLLLFLLRRNLDGRSFTRILLARFLLDMAAALRFLLLLKIGESFAVLRAYLRLALPAGQTADGRMSRQRFQNLPGVFSSSIVRSYYLERKKRFSQLPGECFPNPPATGEGKS